MIEPRLMTGDSPEIESCPEAGPYFRPLLALVKNRFQAIFLKFLPQEANLMDKFDLNGNFFVEVVY